MEPKASHFVLVGRGRVAGGDSDGLHELSMGEEQNRAVLVGETSQPAQRDLCTSEQRGKTLCTWSVAVGRVGALPIGLDVGKPFTSGGTVPPAWFEVCEFLDGPLLYGDGGKSVASRLGGLLGAEVGGDDNQGGSLGPGVGKLSGLFPSLLRQFQLCQVVARNAGIASALSMANKNGAHELTLRGAEETRPETEWNAGFITRTPLAKRSQIHFG